VPSQHAAADVASIEAISVIFAAFLVFASALIQHLSNVATRGTKYVLSDRSVPPSLAGFFGRATRTLANNIESGLMWVPPVVVILLMHQAGWLSQLNAQIYIGARSVFVLSYWLNIPLTRSVAWLVGMICCGLAAVLAVISVF
jgi:uncharacterized MAPEG superfamily protein